MNIRSLPDLENHIREIENEDKIMQANLEANLLEITNRINFKTIVEQIVKDAREDPGFVRKAALAGAALLINHLPVKFGGSKSKHNILSTLLNLVPASRIAFAGEKAANQLLHRVQKLKDKRNKKTEPSIDDSY